MKSPKDPGTPDQLGSIIKTSGQIGMEEATRRGKSAVERFRWAIRPIYALLPRDQVEHIATCTLLNIDRVRLLVTAAHVIDQHSKNSSLLIGGRDRIVNLEAEFQKIKAPEDSQDADHFDFAFAPVTDEMAAKLGAVEYIPESAISLGRRAERRYFYHCVGFPNSKNKDIFPAKVSSPRRNSGPTRPMASYRKRSPKAGTTPRPISSSISAKDHSRDAATGKIVNSIKPRGASGGPVFFVSAFSDPEELRPGRRGEHAFGGHYDRTQHQDAAVVAVKINLVLAAAREIGLLPR